MFRIPALTVAIGLVSAAPAARADIIIGNLPGNDSSAIGFATVGSAGVGFTMTGSYQLTSATLRLSVPTGGMPTVLLMSDMSGNPSATLFTFTDPAFGSRFQNYKFTPPNPITLVGGTTYWLVMQANASTNGTSWEENVPSANTPTGLGAVFAGARFEPGSFPPTLPTTLPTTFQIDGTVVTSPVPAPPAVVLVGLGAGCVALRRYVGRRVTA
jgi:hypothetical protein